MMSAFNHDRFILKPLTKEAAEATGHIAWIEDDDPVSALRKMRAALAQKPYNAAVWANADDRLSKAFRDAVGTWRQGTTLGDKFYIISGAAPLEKAVSKVKDHFSKVADNRGFTPGDAKAAGLLQDHIEKRLKDIDAAIHPSEQNWSLRSGEKTRGNNTAHVDGSSPGMLRLIESIESPTTCLIDNKDVYFGKPSPEYETYLRAKYGEDEWLSMKHNMNRDQWVLNPEGEIAFWQVPANSLLLLSNGSHPWQPAMHAFAPAPKDAPAQKRTVLVYDFTL